MRCFVTGATGFLGGAIVRELLAAGHEVVGLTHRSDNVAGLQERGVEPAIGDMRRPETWRDRLRGTRVVIHAAQLPPRVRMTRRAARELAAADLLATRALVESLPRGDVTFLYTSGAWIYGDGANGAAKTEDSPPRPYPIAAYRIEGEALALRANDPGTGRVAMVLRPGMIYGDGGLFRKLTLEPILRGGRVTTPGDGRQIISPIHVQDCARAFLRAIENPLPGKVVNIADDEPTPFRTLVEALVGQLNGRPPLAIPRILFRLVAGNLVAAPVLGDTRVSNARLTTELGLSLRYPTYREGTAAIAHGLRPAA